MTQETVKLKCECGADFERQQVPEEWKKIVFYKWRFRWCDSCVKKNEQEALKRLPEVLKALSDQTNV
jgi:hypothetical protein